MKKLRPLARIVRNCARFIRDLLNAQQSFVRLTPQAKGKLTFWDKKSNQLISFFSRGEADSSVLDSIFLKTDYKFDSLPTQPSVKARYIQIIKSGKQPLIVDCGANIGASTAYFATQYPAAFVIGLELEPEMHR